MGVESNTFDIPDLVLSDTFFEWFTTTNTSIIKTKSNGSAIHSAP